MHVALEKESGVAGCMHRSVTRRFVMRHAFWVLNPNRRVVRRWTLFGLVAALLRRAAAPKLRSNSRQYPSPRSSR